MKNKAHANATCSQKKVVIITQNLDLLRDNTEISESRLVLMRRDFYWALESETGAPSGLSD